MERYYGKDNPVLRQIPFTFLPGREPSRKAGAKSIDSADFKKVAEIMQAKGHLSKDGLDQILKIKSPRGGGGRRRGLLRGGMNKGRS